VGEAALAHLEQARRPGLERALHILETLAIDAHGPLLDQAIRRRRTLDQTSLLERDRHADARLVDPDGLLLDVLGNLPTLAARRKILTGLLRRRGASKARGDLHGELELDLHRIAPVG